MRDDERDFIARLRSAWGRPELTPAEAAQLERAVQARITAPTRRGWTAGLVAVLAATAAAAVLVLRPAPGPEVAWVDTLVVADAALSSSETADESALWHVPDAAAGGLDTVLSAEYQALALWVAPPDGSGTNNNR